MKETCKAVKMLVFETSFKMHIIYMVCGPMCRLNSEHYMPVNSVLTAICQAG